MMKRVGSDLIWIVDILFFENFSLVYSVVNDKKGQDLIGIVDYNGIPVIHVVAVEASLQGGVL